MDGVPTSSSSLPSAFWPALIVILASFTYLIKTLPHILIPRKIKLPPGPKPWPIVGNLPEMVTNRPTFKWLHKLMKDLDTEIACIRLGNVHVIPVISPAIACKFLKKNDAIFASRPLSMSAELISDGYLTAIISPFGGQWKKMKRIISSELFSPNRLKWLHGRRIEEADNLVWYVYNLCKNDQHKGGLVNLRIVTQQYCGNLVRKMVFNKRYFGEGKKDGGPGFEELEHIEAVFTLLKYLYNFRVSDFMPCLRVFDFDGQEKMLRKALGIIRKYHDPIIEERIQQWKDGEREVQDLLDVLITLKDAHGKPLLTLEEIKAQIIELMIAIVDNPSNAVEWAIAEMINQPHLFQKAIEELDKVVGKDRLVQESDFSKLNYVKACAREAFRLHPVVPFTPPHVSMEDTTVANYFIPKGSHVILSRMGLGRNPRVWNDPNRFEPERHLKNSDGSECDNVILAEQELRFMSFSTGRRGCPGVGLGSAMTVMLFARLLHCFTWSVPFDEKSINLAESENDISLAKPLVATGKPRLAADLYVPH